jgi:hypothetical protein
MRTNLFLADAAQVAEGKLMVLGGGVNIVGGPVAIAGFLHVAWDETNKLHSLSIRLIDSAGNAPAEADFRIDAKFEAGRPPRVPQGIEQHLPIAIGIAPMPLKAGVYEFQVRIDDVSNPEWNIPFTVQASPLRS